VWLAGHILLRTEVLRQGTWTRESRWTEVGLQMLGLVVFIAALWSSHVGQLDTDFLASVGLAASDPRVKALSEGSRALVLAAGPLILLALWSVAHDVWKLLRATASAA
jgi:hypothetical protein